MAIRTQGLSHQTAKTLHPIIQQWSIDKHSCHTGKIETIKQIENTPDKIQRPWSLQVIPIRGQHNKTPRDRASKVHSTQHSVKKISYETDISNKLSLSTYDKMVIQWDLTTQNGCLMGVSNKNIAQIVISRANSWS